MFHAFNRCLDDRLAKINVTPETRAALDNQRFRLAAAEIPQTTDEPTRLVIDQAIDECFVSGFRQVMMVGAALALASSLTAWLVIRH